MYTRPEVQSIPIANSNGSFTMVFQFFSSSIAQGNEHISLQIDLVITRMHSSRMHTVRCSGHPRGCVCLGVSAHGGCLPRGCLPRGVSAQGGVCPGGCLPRGVSAWECLARGVPVRGRLLGGCLPRGVYTPETQRQTPLLGTESQTDVKT